MDSRVSKLLDGDRREGVETVWHTYCSCRTTVRAWLLSVGSLVSALALTGVSCSDEAEDDGGGGTGGKGGTPSQGGTNQAGAGDDAGAGMGGSTTGGTTSVGGDAGTNGGAGEGGTFSGGGDGGESGDDGGADTGGRGGSGGASPGGIGGGGGTAGGGGGPQGPIDLGPHCTACTRDKIGTPAWEPTGALMLTGDFTNGWADFSNTVLPPNHFFDTNQFLIVSSEVHAGPYTNEAYELVTGAGHTPTQTFTITQFVPPYGVAMMLMVVPSAGALMGSSLDFESGPIIPNNLFPMECDGDLFRNGVLFNPVFDTILPGYPQQDPPIAKDGPSHMLWMLATSGNFPPPNTPVEGCYEIVYTVIDRSGSGWIMRVPFGVSDAVSATPMPECFD